MVLFIVLNKEGKIKGKGDDKSGRKEELENEA